MKFKIGDIVVVKKDHKFDFNIPKKPLRVVSVGMIFGYYFLTKSLKTDEYYGDVYCFGEDDLEFYFDMNEVR